jgi:hypothetical protein
VSYAFDLTLRFWEEMIARPSGSMAFRLVLQPAVAATLAIRDGIRDAHFARTPYFWTILNDPSRRRKRLIEGLEAVSRVLIPAGVIDTIYQFVELGGVRPLQTVFVAFLLAFVPYVIVRGPATRIARYFIRRPQSSPER